MARESFEEEAQCIVRMKKKRKLSDNVLFAEHVPVAKNLIL